MALTANSKRPESFSLKENHDPVAASTVIYSGALVCLDSSGNAVPASATTGLIARGVRKDFGKVDNSAGIAGALTVNTVTGVFGFKNKSGDSLTQAEVGDVCYTSTDEEVRKTSGTSVAGVVVKIEAGLVYVAVGMWPLQVGLLAASNLGDVGSAASSRGNLAISSVMDGSKISSKASDAEIFRWVAPVAGTVTALKCVLNAALATADGTVTFKINSTGITSGVVTLTNAASAAGSVFSATPSAANTFAAGDVISATVSGGSTATATFNASILFTY